MKNILEYYDDVVVGSSPLMLIQSLKLAKLGRNVCIIERNKSLGGAWRNFPISPTQNVEIASHLIEPAPGVYKFLQQISNVSFVLSKERAKRIIFDRLTLPYLSILMIFMNLLYLLLGYIFFIFKSRLDHKYLNTYINFQIKLYDHIRYIIPTIFSDHRVRQPICGFSEFIDIFISQCRNLKIYIIFIDVF